jgi:hypothetical protein
MPNFHNSQVTEHHPRALAILPQCELTRKMSQVLIVSYSRSDVSTASSSTVRTLASSK